LVKLWIEQIFSILYGKALNVCIEEKMDRKIRGEGKKKPAEWTKNANEGKGKRCIHK